LFLCYMVRVSRFCGALRVHSTAFEDHEPIFAETNDPFPIRFKVTAEIVLPAEHAIPVTTDLVWNQLAWTRGVKRTPGWGMRFRRSLREFTAEDGQFLQELLQSQVKTPVAYPLSDADRRALRKKPSVQTLAGPVTVVVPEEMDESDEAAAVVPSSSDNDGEVGARESTRVQARLAEIGARMGFNIWIPPNDRARVSELLPAELRGNVLDRLPLNYDEATLRTIQQIDVIWLKGRAMARAFEVEHTTAVYSGLLRMADLLALQPNMAIDLHIVAPEEKREKVFREIQRPVFALLDRGPLADSCTYLSYDSVQEIAGTPNLKHMRDALLDDYAEAPEDA
jgi:hypothetical protein